MKISLGLFLSFIILVSEKISEVEYKGVQKPISILVQKFSPAFAALEDTFEIKNNDDEIIKTFQTHLTSIKSGVPELKIVKLDGFKVERLKTPTLVSVTKKVAFAAKNILEKSFDYKEPVKTIDLSLDDKDEVMPNIASNTKNKRIDIDGVDFEIGGADINHVALNSPQMPQELLSSVIQGINGFENSKIGPISVSQNRSINQMMDGEARSFASVQAKPLINIKGQIELSGGAVYPGERFQFYIQRLFDGVIQERGSINSWTGEFDISVKEPKGKIIIELRHDSGALIALGQLPLNQNSNFEESTLIKVVPAENAHHIGQVLSYESFEEFEVAIENPTEIYIDGDQTTDLSDARGRIVNSEPLVAGSQILVSASHKGYWNSLQIAEAGQPLKAVMHSDKHMKSFLQLIEPYLKTANINSVIWGRVSDQGRPRANVKVALHGFEDIQPLYFSFRIPDPNLESTSSDGFFAFINPPEGLHIIKSDQLNMPLESVVVRMDHTSIVTLETAPKKNVNVYSYEAFQDALNVPAKLSIPGTSSSWKVGGAQLSTLPFFDTSTNMVMDVEPMSDDYLPTRYFIGRRRLNINIPQFKKSWLNEVLSSQKVNQIPRTTSLVGWIEKGSYSVHVYPKDENTRVIYFDKSGNVVESLMDGGGYLATNVPAGVITSTLKENKTNRTIKRLSISEPHRLSVNYINDLSF
jgi:hypothetical protein